MWTRISKIWFSRLLLLLFGLCLVVGAELLLRAAGVGSNYNFVLEGKLPGRTGKYSLNSQYVALHYFHHLPLKLQDLFKGDPWFEDTEFDREKRAGTFRVFTVGASTTRGFPFTDRRISYSGFLEEILSDVLPGRNFEIINVGYDALSSFGILDLVRQIIDLDPDLIIVYTGHNEFIGHFGVNSTVGVGRSRFLIDLMLRLHQSRLFVLNELAWLALHSVGQPAPSPESGVNLFRVMLREDRFTWDESGHRVTERNFEKNLKAIADLGRKRGVPVVFSTLVSNLRDFPPVLSDFNPSLSASRRKVFLDLLEKGRADLRNQNFKEAVRDFREAIQIDPQYAESHFRLAQGYEKVSDYRHAREEYILAREKDRVHLRACLVFNGIIRKLGDRYGVLVMDMDQAFKQISPNGLVGNNLFLEHVHPNINGHLMMADQLAHFLARRNIIEPGTRWQWNRLRSADEYVQSVGFNREQFVRARTTVGRLLLDFPFYKCERGRDMLKSVDEEKHEKPLIDGCFRAVRSLNDGKDPAGRFSL